MYRLTKKADNARMWEALEEICSDVRQKDMNAAREPDMTLLTLKRTPLESFYAQFGCMKAYQRRMNRYYLLGIHM
jgi:predicted PolB exonuclease-like 3'-5' exonuclease